MLKPLNPQQSAVIEWAKTGTGSANVEALAGTGKTYTAEQMASVISGRALFCAFNKAIADELKGRMSAYPHCEAATLHSVGLRLYRKLRAHFDVEGKKVRYISRDVLPFNKKGQDIVCSAVGTAKQMGVGIPGYPHWQDADIWPRIMEDHDLYDEMPSEWSKRDAHAACVKVYDKSMAMCEDSAAVIDFDDMILAPLVMGGTGSWMEMYDWVLVDEAQDLNETRRLLAMRVLRKGGRFVAIGDPHQAIYGFAGATSNSMDLVARKMNSITLPLSVTYRCPQTVVELSKQWVPAYEAHEDNELGTIRNIHHSQFWSEQFTPNDVILCRNTRPLVGIAKRLRKAGIPCLVEGYSPKGLIALAEKWGDITISGFVGRVTEYREVECTRLNEKKKEEKAERLFEKVSCLLELCEDLDPDDGIRRLVTTIERLFGEGDSADRRDLLKLCTIHRAKGREWDRVYLIGRNAYQPSYWAVKDGDPEALQQEENLAYVAVTRTKRELVEVEVPVKDRGKKRKDGEEQRDWWETF